MTVTMHAGAVELVHPGIGGHHPAAVVAGSPPQWDDGTDATYGRIATTTPGPGFQVSRMWAPLDHLDGSLTVEDVPALTVTVRCSSSTIGSRAYSVGLMSPDWSPISGAYSEVLPFTVTGAVGPQNVTVDFTADLPFEPELIPLLQSGAMIWFDFRAGVADDLTVYEVTVAVGAGGDEPAPVEEEIRVTRQFPRDDEYGLGSAPRIFPPPRRGRVVGGYT